MALTNSTLSGNSTAGAEADGGGIYLSGSPLALTNSTLSGNRAADDGGGLFSLSGPAHSFANAIVVGNSAGDAVDDVIANVGHTSTASLFGEVDGGFAPPVTGIAAADVFAQIDPVTGGGQLADNGGPNETIALLDDPANPALDAGDAAAAAGLAFDQRGAGFPRIVDLPGIGATVDIGSFELRLAARVIGQGGNGAETRDGGNNNDQFGGGNGDDTLNGFAGHDRLAGDNGNDVLNGGAGDDELFGGRGNDALTGGSGADRFRLVTPAGTDTITDFEDGLDLIELDGPAGFADLTITPNGDTVVAFGGGAAILTGFAGTLTAEDFVFL